jgi:apolipoprotein N-acyltransferase
MAVASALLLILSFPDFNLWPLAWLGLVPLLIAIGQRPHEQARAFVLGWLTGVLFFYGTCYWLTYAMIRYGHIPSVLAYPLLLPAPVIVGLFPATFALIVSRALSRWGTRAVFIAPFVWIAMEWARLVTLGQLWNAIGYSQAYHPMLIQTARWGGVYAVGFLIVAMNAALAYLFLKRSVRALLPLASIIIAVGLTLYLSAPLKKMETQALKQPSAVVVAVQPNVPMERVDSMELTAELINRHLTLSESALRDWEQQSQVQNVPRIVIWPESPMNFNYAQDTEFRELVARFATTHHTSVLFNSLQPAPANGFYNAAVMVNDEGRLMAQYDKIRLLPFGEYVPLPRWLPGVNLIPAMVGDFTPGAVYSLMPLGVARAGVFICFESAFPSITREFTKNGADVLINIANDGYLGPTPVMRQHLANAVFRAVENDRPVLRVTNTGISAYISARGEVSDETVGFQTAVRTWTVNRANGGQTFYTRHGDLFAEACAVLSLALGLLLMKKQRKIA